MINIYKDIETNINKDVELNELYKQLLELYTKDNIDFVIYDKYKYIHRETENKVKRKDLISRYNRCIITCCNEYISEVRHIVPFENWQDEDKFNVNNGLLLRADIHKLFDNNHLKIDPESLYINSY